MIQQPVAIITFLFSLLILTSCGGGSGDESTSNNESAAELSETNTTQSGPILSNLADNHIVLDAANLPSARLKSVARSAGGVAAEQNSNLDVEGGFVYPEQTDLNGQQLSGNLTFYIEASDSVNIGRLLLVFSDDSEALEICNSCGTSFAAVVNGVSPGQFGWETGIQTLRLMATEETSGEVDLATADLVGSLSINWQKQVVANADAGINSANTLSVSWNALNSALWYNVYIANEPGHTGRNIHQLSGGEAQLGVTGNSVTFANKPSSEDYYVLVTAVNGTGEYAFSEERSVIGGQTVNPPIATPDSFNVNEDSTLTGNLISNDQATGQTTFNVVTTPIIAPVNGEVSINENGSFTYVPNQNFNGTDSFTYQIISSEQLTADALVSINVVPINDVPVLIDESDLEINLTGTTFSSASSILSDRFSDADGDNITVVSSLAMSPRFGSVEITSSGGFIYTRASNFVTYDTFTYRVTDGQANSDAAKVLIKGEEFNGTFPPIALDDEHDVLEDGMLVVSAGNGVKSNDFDDDNDESELTLSLIEQELNGSLSFDEETGAFTYVPSPDFFGLDTFSYRLTDPAGNSTTANVIINVTGQNDAPVAVNDEFSIDEQTTLVISAPGVLSNDTDVDLDSLAAETVLVTNAKFGEVSLNEDGSFSYTPDDTFVTYETFSYRVTDGVTFSNDARVTITSPEFTGSFPPIAVDDHQYEVSEDGFLTVEDTEGLLLNDFDEDNELSESTLAIVETTPNGVLEFTGGGGFTYQPNPDFAGTDIFTYSLTDPDGNSTTAEVSIAVLQQNDAPVANMDQYSLVNVQPITVFQGIGLLVNDTDLEGDTLSVDLSSIVSPTSGSVEVNADGSFTYTAQEGFLGVDSFSYQATDGQFNSASATVEITVIDVNAQTSDLSNLELDLEDLLMGLPGDASVTNITAERGQASIGDGILLYTPPLGLNLVDKIDIEVTIGEQVNIIPLFVRVESDNSPPTITSSNSVSLNENSSPGTTVHTVEAFDIDEQTVTFEILDDEGIFAIDEQTGLLTVLDGTQLDFETNPIIEVTVAALDPFTATTSQVLTVLLNDTGEAPQFTSPNQFSIIENTSNGASLYQAVAVDPEGGDVNYMLSDSMSIFTINSTTGEVTVIDNTNLDHEQTESYDITITADDGEFSANLTVTVNITDLNEAPLITSNSSFSITENSANGTVTDYTATASDPEGNSLSWSISGDEHGIFAINSSTGVISVSDNTSLDFEVVTSYDFMLSVMETNGSPSNLSDSITLTVSILNEDEQSDSDGDGLLDSEEIELGTDPADSDTDDDGLLDGEEVELGTNPNDEDTDNDLINDGAEVEAGTDPLNGDVTPATVTGVQPINGAIDICTNQIIGVSFNELLKEGSVTNANMSLLLDGTTAVDGSVSQTVNGYEIFFAASEALAQNSSYTVQVSGVRDRAGNVMDGTFSSSFTTGTCLESDRPSVIQRNPHHGTTNVPQNTVITVTIDEPIDPSSVNINNMYVVDQVSGQVIPGTHQISDDRTVITFTPDNLLAVGRRHYAYVTTGVRDLFGNTMNYNSFYFDVTFDSDSDQPNVISTTVNNGFVGLPTNGKLAVLFDEPVNTSLLAGVTLTDSSDQVVATTMELNDRKDRVVLTPVDPLATSTSYNFNVGGIEDLTGNAGIDEQISFTTGEDADTETGSDVTWSIPNNNTQNVALNPVLTVTLSEPIDPTTLNASTLYLYDNSTGLNVSTTRSLSADGMTLRIEPDEALEPNRRYYMYVGYWPYLTDYAGNVVAQNRYRYFNTGDEVDAAPLAVTSSSILDGMTNMPINGDLVLVFDQELSNSCPLSDAVTLITGETEVATTATLASDRRTVTITSESPLTIDTAYQLSISGLCDYAGNVMTGVTYNFTTNSSESNDTTGPTLVSITPTHQSTDVSVTTSIVLEYSEEVDLRSKPPVTGDSSTGNITVQGTYDVDGNTITFIPDQALQGDTRYTIGLYSNVPDYAGNTVYGGTRYFNTQAVTDTTAPSIVAISPADGSVDVDPSKSLVFTFDEPINNSTLVDENIAFYHNGSVLSPSLFRSADGREVTVTANLPANALISVVINDAVTDLSGNAMAPFVSSFTTGSYDNDFSRPNFTKRVPTNGSSGWKDIKDIYFYMSEAMDPNTLADGLKVSENGVLVDVTTSLSGDGRTIKVSKDTSFAEGAYVQYFWNTNLTDISGNPIYETNGYFTMDTDIDEIGNRAHATAYSPNSSTVNTPLNPVLLASFSEDIDVASLNDETVILYDVTAGWVVMESSYTVTDQGNVIAVTPEVELVTDNQYYVWFGVGILDTDGDNLATSYATYFYTHAESVVDDRQPLIEAMSPPGGTEGVGTLPYFSVRMDEPVNTIAVVHDKAINVQFSENNRVIKYEHRDPLPPLMEHREFAPAMMDFSGNDVVNTSAEFITANGPDFINPSVLDTSYVNNQQNVTLNPVFEWTFSEPIDPNSATSAGIYIWDDVTNETIPSTFELSPDGKRLTVVPTEELLVLRRYYQYSYNMHDLSGNNLGSHYRYINTGTANDTTPPSITQTTVNEGDSGVPTNVKLNVRFDESLNPLDVSGISLRDSMDQEVPVNVTLSRSRTFVSIVPKQLLNAFSSYQLTVDGMKDLAGNVQASSMVTNFMTGATVDMTTGSAVRWSIPNNNTQNVPLNPLLQVTMSEPIDPATVDSGSFYLWDNVSGLSVPGQWQISADNLTLTFTPDEPLRENARHYLYVGYSPYLTDLAANVVAFNSYRYFTTSASEDNSAPVVTSSNFIDGNEDIPINGHIVLTYDEELADTCLLQDSVTASSDSGAHELEVSLESDRRTIVITSASTFDASSNYTISIDGLCDYAGNAISGYELTFTTTDATAEDNTGPSLVSITPVHGATDVSVNLSSIVMEYDEPVDIRSAPPVVGGNITVPGDYVVNGNIITFTPSISLLGSTRYTVQLYSNVPDLAGNTIYGSTRYFDTEAVSETVAPTVTAISPASGASDINPAQSVEISFSEPMLASSINSSNIVMYHNGARIQPSLFRSADNQKVTLSASLPQNALIDVVINDAVTDLSGNALAPYISSFTTGPHQTDTGRPSITQQIPSNGSSGWVDLDTITLYANEALDPASLTDSMVVQEDGVITTANISLSGDNRTLTITKDGGFSVGKRTTFYLSGITDSSGNLIYDYSGSIVMDDNVEGIGERAFVTGYAPDSGTVNTPLNPVLMAGFSEPIEESSLSDTRVTLQDVTNNWTPMTVTYSLDSSGKVIRVVPDDELVPNNQYYLWFSGEILDTDGDQISGNQATYFYTHDGSVVDNVQPMVTAISPPQDENNVGTNARFSVRFDEPMSSLTFDTDTNRKSNVSFSENNQVITYTHLEPLAPSTEHTETITDITDMAGNVVVAASSTFMTADGPDFVNPTLVDTALFNNQQNVATNPVIEWVFSEPIDIVSVTGSGVYMWNDNTSETIGSSWELSADGKRLSVMPDAALESGSRHYAYAYSLRDLSGNSLGNHYRYFTVGTEEDTTAPSIVSTTVFEGQTGVPTNVKLKVRFDEILNPVLDNVVSLKDSSNQDVPINISLSRERMLLNIVPKQLLAANSVYTLNVANMVDISDNAQETPLSVSFTTGNTVDLATSGVKTWSIPVNNTQNVPLNPKLEVTFHERVDVTTVDSGSFYLWNNTTGENTPGSWTLSSDGLTLEFTPDELLDADTRYYLYVGYSPYLMDMAGNLIAQNNYRYFTTGTAAENTALTVNSTNIFDGNTDMPVNGQVVMVMERPISDSCLYTDNVKLHTSSTEVPINISLASNRQTLTITGQENFDVSTQYDLSVLTLCDYAGNEFSGSVLSFTTLADGSEDTSGPTLSSSSPINGDDNVDIGSNIVWVYNEPVDVRSAPPVLKGGEVVPGSYNVVGNTITFTPVMALEYETTYTIQLRYNVPDFTGRTSWGGDLSFTTAVQE